MEKSVLLVGADALTTYQKIYTPTWGHRWGDGQEYLDPGNIDVYNWYRTQGGQIVNGLSGPYDSVVYISQRHYGSPYVTGTTASANGDTNATIIAKQGAWPHINKTDLENMQGTADDYLCPVYWDKTLMYYLFKEPGLPGVCNPGSYFVINTVQEKTTYSLINSPSADYNNSGMTVNGTLASGSTTLVLNMPWVSTNASGTTGFYLTTNYLHEDGYLYIGPNSDGHTGIASVTSITDDITIEVSPMEYDFAEGDPILYKYIDLQKTMDIPMQQGTNTDVSIAGYTTLSGGKDSKLTVELHGGLETFTVIETFVPIPWAIPAPYSIRNVPSTYIWQRLSNPSVPINWDTLIYKVNGQEVTDKIDITLITGGAELMYQPEEEFELNSRVSIYVYATASPTVTRTFARNTPSESIYVQISGDISTFQPGGMLELGPNPADESESAEVLAIVSSDIIMLKNVTTYDYVGGDAIQYVYSDYPLELNYWFDIVNDFYPPTIFNMYPYEGMTNVDHNHWIRFEIQDVGLGVDISTLIFTVNNLVVYPDIYKYSNNWYQVIYTPPQPFYYNSTVSCFVTVADLSTEQNRGFAVWSFKTGEAENPIILNPEPSFGAWPISLKSDITFDVYGRAGGVNFSSLVTTVDGKEFVPLMYPKIYRFK
jgi:hypothetical protein